MLYSGDVPSVHPPAAGDDQGVPAALTKLQPSTQHGTSLSMIFDIDGICTLLQDIDGICTFIIVRKDEKYIFYTVI